MYINSLHSKLQKPYSSAIKKLHFHLNSPAAETMSNTSSLLRASFNGDLLLLKKLVAELDDGSDLAKTIAGIRGPCSASPLHLCIVKGKFEVCKYLIADLKLDIHSKEGILGDTPLNLAIQGGYYEIAKYLLENGANPDTPNDKNVTALHFAALKEDVKLLHLLLSKGVNVDALSDEGTALRWATVKGNHAAVKLLLHHHANPNISYRQSPTPLMVSVYSKSLQCMNLLLEAGADPDGSAMGVTPLTCAAGAGEADMVLSLLKAGANPNLADEDRLTPIEIAAVGCHKNIVEILFPVTSPIPNYLEWSVTCIMKHGHTAEARVQVVENYVNAKVKGDASFRNKDYSYAILCYSQALIGNPPNAAVILSNRSLCWLRQRVGKRALQDANDCIELKPDWSKAYYRAGSALSQLMKHDEASTMFAKALDLDPSNEEIQKAFQDSIAEGMKERDFCVRTRDL